MRNLAPAVLVLLVAGSSLPAAGPPVQAGTLGGRGASGAGEVGRPLEVLRQRAEREARDRAVASLLFAARSHLPSADPARLEEKVRSLAAGDLARWDLGYWSNGAVSALVTIPSSAIEPE